ncbi:MAG: hypothetical protein U9N84_15730, partial [Actinomycetota bacterium]|nr:hypothetical protein [Actinomycetota bacterium]
MGPAGIALSVQFETSPEEQPLLLVFEQYEVVLDHMHDSFTLTNTGSGEVVLTGSSSELFNWGGDGQRVFDPATGELLTTVPHEIWERAWNDFYGGGSGGSPLPIPIEYEAPDQSVGITIEYDGLVINIDERADTFVVTDAESGDEVASGSMNELYQGPAPSFVDPETGEVLLAVTWDEWYAAEDRAYTDWGYEDYDYSSRTALVTSADGEIWAVEMVGNRTGGSTSYLAATGDGFVAMVKSYGEVGADHGTVWTMVDGVWLATPSERSDLWLQSITSTDDGLVGVGDGSGGPALWSSPDGVTWTSEFAIVPQDDGSYAWLTTVTADDAGTLAALAVRERWSEHSPLIFEQEKYTATFEDGETMLRVTETGTGTAVLSLGWQELEDGSAAGLFTWDNEATSISLSNGDVMVITDDEAYAAMESQYAGAGQIGLSVFLNHGSGWVEAVVDVEGGFSGASQLFLDEGRIIIGGSYWDMEPYYHEGPVDSTFVIVVGTPVGE